tara:strand:- start:3458 stop:3637 length:180 start_codon:yes stop_codon:yes gene_type:complete
MSSSCLVLARADERRSVVDEKRGDDVNDKIVEKWTRLKVALHRYSNVAGSEAEVESLLL